METYIKQFENKQKAIGWMNMKNDSNRVKYRRWVVVDGPNNNYAVVDIKTAIELGCGYIF
jgi:hypothetical protein